MRWTCPYSNDRECALFDGRCQPDSDECLMSRSAVVWDDDTEAEPASVMVCSAWPEPESRCRLPRAKGKLPARRPRKTAPH